MSSFSLAVLVGFLSIATAASANPENQRTCRAIFLGEKNQAPATVHLFDGKTFLEVSLSTMNFSPVQTLAAGPVRLTMFLEPPESLEAIPAGLPQVMLAENLRDIYLLITQDPQKKPIPFTMRAVDANPEKFRPGQTMWFNLTASRIGGELGGKKLLLEPGSRKITAAPTTGIRSYPVSLFYQLPEGKRAWPLTETKWQHNPNGRMVTFVINQPGSKVPRIMGFPDFRAPPEPNR